MAALGHEEPRMDWSGSGSEDEAGDDVSFAPWRYLQEPTMGIRNGKRKHGASQVSTGTCG